MLAGPSERHDETGDFWYCDGRLHRDTDDDQPAAILPDGTEIWYKYGLRHRATGPAIVYPDGTRAWYRYGLLHRDAGPAIERHDGTNIWYCRGECHRADGPAVIRPDGTLWYHRGTPREPGLGPDCAIS